MSIEIKVPVLPESVTDATIVTWHKKAGEKVARDENLVDIETDKVVLEVVAPNDGILDEIIKNEGAVVKAKEVIARFTEGGASAVKPKESSVSETKSKSGGSNTAVAATAITKATPTRKLELAKVEQDVSPSVRRLIKENDLDINEIEGSGPSGRVTTEDVENHLKNQKIGSDLRTGSSSSLASISSGAAQKQGTKTISTATTSNNKFVGVREERRVPMSRLRARIAERLLQAQHNAAILTTFNEINMQPLMDLRAKYKDKFEKDHGVRLGFMSFFTLAAVEALKRFPEVNASIDGSDIVYHGYFDIGIAVSSPRGLVVPILKDADTLTVAGIEEKIKELGDKAKDNQLSIEDITGGTFTISNGGVFGSLMSTPILNPPQSAILGMHKIEERPIVENKQIVIRPMMYVALSYDHRIIDGKESVQFLVTIKEMIEDPARLLLGI